MSSISVRSSFSSLVGFVLLASSSAMVQAQNVEQRLARLENLMNSQVLMEQSQRMEQIQQELSSLREMLERQEHQLNMIKQRQRNLYQDMDRRLHDLEIKGGGTSSGGQNVAPVAAPGSSVSPIAAPVAAGSNSAGVPAVAPVSGDKHGKGAYSQAFNTLKQGKYQDAIQAFRGFLQSYPDSIYGGNAQYWLGEAYSASRDYQTALSEFQKVVSQYPQSNKVEGAMLKIGYTYYELQDWASAKSALEQVVNKYPGSTVARKAKERLQRMLREGH